MRAIDRSFYVPRTPIAIIDCADPPEARAILTLLGNLRAVVTMHTSRLQFGGTFFGRGTQLIYRRFLIHGIPDAKLLD